MAKAARNRGRDLDRFLAVSIALTGEDRLDKSLAAAYLAAIRKADPAGLAALLNFAGQAKAQQGPAGPFTAALAGNTGAAACAKQVVYLWYAGGLRTGPAAQPHFLSENAYFGGLLWRCVGAHAPALSGGYFGHWRYPPDD